VVLEHKARALWQNSTLSYCIYLNMTPFGSLKFLGKYKVVQIWPGLICV
jgi:hypothetical protein